MTLASRLDRIPLRRRLVAGFSVATFVVLLAAGALVYWRVDYALDRGIDTDLVQASQALSPLVHSDGTIRRRSIADATGVAWQVLDSTGQVLDHGGAATIEPIVRASRLEGVVDQPRIYNVGDLLPISRAPYRVRITPLPQSDRYLLVGVRRDHRDEALRELLLQLVVAGIGTLVVTAVVGDRLARAALRPVERYRVQAAAIASGATDLRLEVSEGRDDEVTRLGHTLNDMLASLERAVERERRFVDEASHELRTPITLISSRLQLARRRERSPEHYERVLGELQVDVDRLAALADQLLQIGVTARRAGTDSSPMARCDLGAVVARVVDQRRTADPAHAADLVVSLPTRHSPVAATDVDVERIVSNLLANADAHGAAPIGLTLDQPEPGWWRLSVRDAGPGMSRELLATATQRFARADDARHRPGAGLGLALIETLVERLGGELRLCFAGVHRVATSARVDAAPTPPCAHTEEMTVTVLLPEPPPEPQV